MTAASRPAAPRPIVLVVLDGFGIGHDPAADAIAAAPMPTWRGLLARWPHAILRRLGGRGRPAAGPDGQLRGRAPEPRRRAGRCSRTCRASTPRSPTARSSSARRCSRPAGGRRRPDGRLHVVSLIGPGGVHANDRHLVALAELAARARRPARSASTPCSTGATRRRARPSGSSPTSRRGSPPPTRMRGSRRSAAATTRWIATSAGTASSAATTRSSTGWGEHAAERHGGDRGRLRPRRERRVRRARRSSTASTARVRDGDPVIHANFRADRARQLTHALADARPSTASTGPRPTAVRPRPTCSS